MTSPTSPIADLYPTNFQIDSNGNRFGSQSVVLVEFVGTYLSFHYSPLLQNKKKKLNYFRRRKSVGTTAHTS
jgi:5'-3' exonuclease